IVLKSIKRNASAGFTTRNANIKTAPIMAAPGRSIFMPGKLPIAKPDSCLKRSQLRQASDLRTARWTGEEGIATKGHKNHKNLSVSFRSLVSFIAMSRLAFDESTELAC